MKRVWREKEQDWETEWGTQRERGNEGEKDNKKTNVCQNRHASACQSIPLWLIWKGWFLARRTLEALTRLLLHSSASHKASVCSNWLWIRSYWLEVSKINKHNEVLLCVCTSKILTRCSIQKGNKNSDCCRINHRGTTSLGCQSLFFVFILKSIKVSSCNYWCQCLRHWPSRVENGGGSDVLCFSTMDSSPPHCPVWEPRGDQKATLGDWEQSHTLAGLL